ncbi:MAG: prenyltransferase [Thermaerobacter sp.]|nr:prenyltransferase [Thermaerobacter sp.]
MSAVKLLGALQLSRPIPLAVWTLGTVMLGASAAPHLQTDWILPVAAVLVGGILLQGYITHGINDLFDWYSGTDKENPAWLSGGSHAVQSGRLQPADLRLIAVFAIGAYLVLLLALSVWRGAIFALLGVPALIAAIAYSLPPFRLGYRPLLGEWLGMFPTIASGVLAAGYAAGGVMVPELWAVAIINGIMCNASVMEHHLADVELDWAAAPQKRTSPAFWQKAIGRPGSEVAMTYALLVCALSLAFSWLISVRFALTAVLALAAAVIAHHTRMGDREDETRRDAALKGIALANALGFAVFAVLGVR